MPRVARRPLRRGGPAPRARRPGTAPRPAGARRQTPHGMTSREFAVLWHPKLARSRRALDEAVILEPLLGQRVGVLVVDVGPLVELDEVLGGELAVDVVEDRRHLLGGHLG